MVYTFPGRRKSSEWLASHIQHAVDVASARLSKRIWPAVCCGVFISLWLISHLLSSPLPSRHGYNSNTDMIQMPTPVANFDFNTTPIILVSAFFPLPTSKHTVQEYASWLSLLLSQVSTPLVIYTSPTFSETIEQLRGNLPVIIDTRFESPFHVPAMKGLEEVYQRQHDQLDPEWRRHNAALYATWNAKAWLLHDAATKYAGNKTEWFFWTDAGALRQRHTFVNWPDVGRVRQVFEAGAKRVETSPQDLFFIPIFDAPEKSYKTSNWRKEDGPLDLYMMSEGSFFGGQLPAVTWWYKAFYDLHDTYLASNRFVGKDQNLFNSLMFLHPSRFLTVWPRDPLHRQDRTTSDEGTYPQRMCTWDVWYYYIYWLSSSDERSLMKDFMRRWYEKLSVFVRFLAWFGFKPGKVGRGECSVVSEWTFDEILMENVGR
ncbi:hypothetical protein FRC03_008635 [Tulasnella sp. 419]|nr:hypothetical protein FRC03_008635 [Tulasnella sp. 419]